MIDNEEVTRTLGENDCIILEYAIRTHSDMCPKTKYRENIHLIQITFYPKPVILNRKNGF